MTAAHSIAIGGLMRCCINTLDTDPEEANAKPGDVLDCKWCDSQMRLHDDEIWRWINTYDDDRR